MPLLSELVKFRNDLKEMSKGLSLESSALAKIFDLETLHEVHTNVDYSNHLSSLVSSYKELVDKNAVIQSGLATWIDQINQDIEVAAQTVSAEATFKVDELTPERTMINNLPEEVVNDISVRIKGYCDWHYAALQIGCKFKVWTDCMVTADPLYLTNYYEDDMYDVVKTFSNDYQRRLRPYICSYDQLAKQLPNNQYSFILAWEMLNYASAEEIESIISQAYTLLRPGGTFMFTYNNCELAEGAHLAEIHAMSYTTQTRLDAYCQQLGFTDSLFTDYPVDDSMYPYVSWCEVRKPGELTTTKAHQLLGKIVEK